MPRLQAHAVLHAGYLLNTRAASFFNFDWANRAALTYICEQCGHILWFADDVEDED